MHLAGCTATPTGRWLTQQARQFAWALHERRSSFRFLIRDRDSKFTHDFDAIFASEAIEIIKTPARAPRANATAERLARTARTECLDWLLIVNRRHLERVLRVFADHYNTHRPHRSLNLKPPDPAARKLRLLDPSTASLERKDRLGGLLHEYRAAARTDFAHPTRLADVAAKGYVSSRQPGILSADLRAFDRPVAAPF